MNLHAITLVQDSLALLQEEETALALFQDRLGVLDPALRALLTAGVAGGGRDLLAVLSLGIRGLNAPETVIPALKAIGRDHTRQGIRPHHYQPIGEAMLWAVAQLQGDGFDGVLAGAWAEAFYLIAGLMKEAACEPSYTRPAIAEEVTDSSPLIGHSALPATPAQPYNAGVHQRRLM